MKSYVAPLIIALSVITGVFILGNAYKYKFKTTETISVTGLAETNFTSDQIVWTGNYSRKTMDLKSAYAQLKTDEGKIRSYLKGKGVTDAEMVFSAISIDKEFESRYDDNGRVTGSEFTGYNLKQNVTVDSKDIEKVEKISREVTELIESGIEFNSSSPSYYYTKLSELKIDLLAKAGYKREEVFIANVVKCRPTIDGLGQRDRPPEADEVKACAPYLRQQIELINPQVIVTLGNPSTRFLLNTMEGITKLRGKWQNYNGIAVMPTYHPSFLLRNGGDAGNTPHKRDVWNDMKQVIEKLGF